jgi:hypothetical protein
MKCFISSLSIADAVCQQSRCRMTCSNDLFLGIDVGRQHGQGSLDVTKVEGYANNCGSERNKAATNLCFSNISLPIPPHMAVARVEVECLVELKCKKVFAFTPPFGVRPSDLHSPTVICIISAENKNWTLGRDWNSSKIEDLSSFRRSTLKRIFGAPRLPPTTHCLPCEALATSIDVATLFLAALGIAKGTLTACVFGQAKKWYSQTSFFEKSRFTNTVSAALSRVEVTQKSNLSPQKWTLNS